MFVTCALAADSDFDVAPVGYGSCPGVIMGLQLRTVHQRILDILRQLEQTDDIKVLLAVESGCRAWGFESRDSDWDVRFLYVHRRDWYLAIDRQQRDVIERPIIDELDVSGWDLRKALLLLHGSNPPLLEWMACSQIYLQQTGIADRMTDLAKDDVRAELATMFTDPWSLDPARRAARVTREVATYLADLAVELQADGTHPEVVARFLMRCLFTMFAEDIGLLEAGWAHAAFAGERDKLLEAARWTRNAGESLVEEAAVDVLAELALDKGRINEGCIYRTDRIRSRMMRLTSSKTASSPAA